jgi:hypothetical protein
MGDPQGPGEAGASAGGSSRGNDHTKLEQAMPVLLWPAFLLLAGALAHLVDPSFRLGPWVWHGGYPAQFGKALIVGVPLAAASFALSNRIFGLPVTRLRR